MQFADYILILIYLALVLGTGVSFARRKTSTDDLLMGGRRIPWWAACISYIMALLSTVSLVAVPGEAYNNGLRFYFLELISPIFMIAFFVLFMRFYFASRVFTPFTYLEQRFSPPVRAVISAIYLFTRMSYLALVMYSGSVIMRGMAGGDDRALIANGNLIILLTGLIAIIYCSLGGMKGVIWSNVLQFAILAGTLALVMVWATMSLDGGMSGVVQYAFANDRGFGFERIDSSFFSFDPHVRVTFWLLTWSAMWSAAFSNSADQIAIQQMLSTSSFRQGLRSMIGASIIFVPLGLVMWYLGLSMFAYYRQQSGQAAPAGDMALMRFVVDHMPSPMPGLFVAAMFSALMSTLAAGILSLGTVATKDLYGRFIRPDMTERQEVRASRAWVIGIGIISTLMALGINQTATALRESVLEASSIWQGISCVIAPTFFVAVLSKRCTARQILLSMAAGLLVTLVSIAWYIVSKQQGHPISFMFIQIPGGIAVLLLGFGLPLLNRSDFSRLAVSLTDSSRYGALDGAERR